MTKWLLSCFPVLARSQVHRARSKDRSAIACSSHCSAVKLTGTLAPGSSELGLFVTLGSFSKDAIGLGRTRQDFRPVSGKELVEMIFENYDKLPAERKRLLLMRSVWVIDRDPGVL